MTEDNFTKCAHGITKADRRLVGCRKCDAESHDEFRAAQEAAKFRARVIQTARAVLPQYADLYGSTKQAEIDDRKARAALAFAEAFERAADAYLKDGGGN